MKAPVGVKAPAVAQARPLPGQTLRGSVGTALNAYLKDVDESYIRDLYATVMAEVEPPLLAAVMHKARSNQSRAALMLGITRATLRKKLRHYNMLD